MMDWVDISFHTIPSVIVGGLMGFMAGFGLQADTFFERVIWVSISTIAALAFSYMWVPREKRQHNGHLGGIQSVFEAVVPLAAGPVAFVVSTVCFYIWPL